MGYLWIIWKPRVVFVSCVWALLAFVFFMEKHGNHYLTVGILPSLWCVLSKIVLLGWLDTTLVTGAMAIAAACIGVWSAHVINDRRDNNDKIAAVRLAIANFSLMCDTILLHDTPPEEDLESLLKSSENLGQVDGLLQWLGIACYRYVRTFKNQRPPNLIKVNFGPLSIGDYRTAFLCAAFSNMLSNILDDLIKRKFVGVGRPHLHHSKLDERVSKQFAAKYGIGQMQDYIDWSK